jgi:hypothetical protein
MLTDWWSVCRVCHGRITLSPRTRICAPCGPFISQTAPEADKRNLAAYDAGKS